MKKKIRITIGLLFLTTWMSVFGNFTLNGTTIEQTGTDTDLSGLASITGVTTTTESRGFGLDKTIYHISGLNLSYENLTFDATKEKLVFEENCPVKRLFPSSSTSSLTINGKKTYMGNEVYTDDEAIVFLRADSYAYNNAYQGHTGDFYINQGSFEWNGGIIKYSACVQISVGTINKGTLVSFGNGATTTDSGDPSTNLTTTGQIKLYGGVYHDLTVVGGNYVIVENSAVDIRQIETIGCMRGIEINVDDVEVANFDSKQGFSDMGIIYNKRGILKNPVPDEINVGGHVYYENNATHSINRGALKRYKVSKFENVKNGDNTAFDGVYYIKDYDSGNRASGYFTEGLDDIVVQGSVSGGSSSEFNVITGLLKQPTNGGGNTNYTWDYRGKNSDTTHIFDVYLLSYHNFIGSFEQTFKGADTQDISFLAATDSNITESTKATVDAYTEIDNLDKLYDRAKSWKVDSANIERPSIGALLATADGATLDLDDHDLVIDASAASAFEVDKTNKKITIKASALATGTRFTGIKTTGTISTANSATIEFGYEDSTGINKFVHLDWGQSIIEHVSVINLDNNNAIIDNVSATQTFKDHFVMPSPAPTNGIRVEIKTPGGFRVFEEGFPETDLNFIRLNVTLNASEERQGEMLFLTRKLLQKSEGINEALTGNTPSITDNTTTTTSNAGATNENQVAILQLLRRIMLKVSANKEALQKE